jgi:hypothetical protein
VEDLQTYINDHVKPMVERGELVQVRAVARALQSTFPQHSLATLAQLVFASVVRLSGSAELGDS